MINFYDISLFISFYLNDKLLVQIISIYYKKDKKKKYFIITIIYQHYLYYF